MNRLPFLAFTRSLTRHKLYAALNIGGLAVGIAVFLVLGLYVRFETSFEQWLPNAAAIYQIETKADDPGLSEFSNSSPVALWTAVEQDLPDIVGTRVWDRSATVVKNGVGVAESLSFVDAGFAKVFDLPMVSGNLSAALSNPTDLVIDQTVAHKYFGSADPIGKTMTIIGNGKTRSYRVAAIIRDLPHNTDFGFEMIARLVLPPNDHQMDTFDYYQWNYHSPETFVRLPDRNAAAQFSQDLKAVIDRHAASETIDQGSTPYRMNARVQPLTAVHFEEPGKSIAVATLGIVGLLTLLIAIVNYVNLATARAGLRAREVAMRKVLGADRRTILIHYLGEAMGTVLIAAIIGLAITECALPLVNAAGALKLSLAYGGRDGVLLPLALMVLFVGLAAGLYPAAVLSRFPAAAVLASARTPGGGRTGARVREGLVIVQFTIAIAFVICTFVLVSQTRHVRTAEIGYSRHGLMLIDSLQYAALTDGQRETILHRLATLPGVISVTNANNAPGPNGFTSNTSIQVPGVSGEGPSFRFFQTTPGFFKTVGAHLLAGRLFDASRPADTNPNYGTSNGTKPYNIVVNRRALRFLHIATPQAAIGRTFTGPDAPPRTIIGVVEDMRFDDARAPIPPTFYEFVVRPPDSSIAMLRFTGDAKALTNAARQVWLQEAASVPFAAMTADQNLARLYKSDDRSANLFSIGAGLAVAIGCVGLWGLASFNTARRTKEIGIRKTLGASSTDIVRLLVGQFLRPVLVANLFAWPLAFFAMRTWLAGFDDRIALSPLYFVAATGLAVGIAVLTVLAQALRASRANPAWALRHE